MAVRAQEITFAASKRRLDGYLVRPDGPGPFPGIVVIHEAYGLNENIKDVSRRLAAEGYAALGVDLFAGRNRAVCMARLFGGMTLNSLDHGGIRDLKSALTHLAAQPGVDAEKLGAIGFCLGGGLAIAWACTDNRLKAIAPYYAPNPRPLAAVRRLCPVVGSYPTGDFTTKQGQKLDVALDGYGVPHDIKVYPDAKHSFFSDRGRAYHPAAAADSWQRVLSFFDQYLTSPAGS